MKNLSFSNRLHVELTPKWHYSTSVEIAIVDIVGLDKAWIIQEWSHIRTMSNNTYTNPWRHPLFNNSSSSVSSLKNSSFIFCKKPSLSIQWGNKVVSKKVVLKAWRIDQILQRVVLPCLFQVYLHPLDPTFQTFASSIASIAGILQDHVFLLQLSKRYEYILSWKQHFWHIPNLYHRVEPRMRCNLWWIWGVKGRDGINSPFCTYMTCYPSLAITQKQATTHLDLKLYCLYTSSRFR